MNQFRELYRIRVDHAYYGGLCRDFEFLIPEETIRLMQASRILARQIDGILYVVYETDGTTNPAVNFVGRTLRFAARIVNPAFSSFTAVVPDFAARIQPWPVTGPDITGFSDPMPSVGTVFHHTIVSVAPSVNVTVYDSTMSMQSTETVLHGSKTEIIVDTAGRAPGTYKVTESWPGNTVDYFYYVDDELRRQHAAFVIEALITLDGFLGSNEITISYDAREETLRYYIVTKGYSDAEILLLDVDDMGFGPDGRPAVEFDRVEIGAFGSGELLPSLLAGGDEKIVLFRSQAVVPRRSAGRTRIQLTKGAEVLVANLPQPGPEKADAHMIIHLTKP